MDVTDAEDPATLLDMASIVDLEPDALTHILHFTCAKTLSRASQVCQVFCKVAPDAAVKRGVTLGYCEEFEDLGEDTTQAIKFLHHLHEDPSTAMLPVDIPTTGKAALRMLRTDFAHFQPCLCQVGQLWLPDESTIMHPETDGAAEYATLTAILRSAAVSDGEQGANLRAAAVNTRSLQECIEAGWADGFDAEGAANFGGVLAGKTHEAAYIGAAEALVALLHLRFRAFIVEFRHAPSAGDALYRLVRSLYTHRHVTPGRDKEDEDNGYMSPSWVRMPMMLQMSGHSYLILGVTTAIKTSIVVADLADPGAVVPMDCDELNDHQYQLVVLRGDGPEAMTIAQIRAVTGQRDGVIEPGLAWDATPVTPSGIWRFLRPLSQLQSEPSFFFQLACWDILPRDCTRGGSHFGVLPEDDEFAS